MAIEYSGGTLINYAFTQTTGTRAELVTAIITQLLAAGWTNLSGTGTDQVLQCVATTSGINGLRIAVRVYDPGSGNCARVALRNVSGSRIGQDLYLLPAVGKQWMIIANQYQFFVMTPGSSAAREFVFVAELIVPTWLGTTINCGVAQGNGSSDTDATAISTRPSFRTDLHAWGFNSGGCRFTVIIGDVMLDLPVAGAGATYSASLRVLAQHGGGLYTNSYRWADGTLLAGDALVACGLSSSTDEAKWQGQLSDAVVVAGPFAADTQISLDGNTWSAITNNNAGTLTGAYEYSNRPGGTLFIRVA